MPHSFVMISNNDSHTSDTADCASHSIRQRASEQSMIDWTCARETESVLATS